MNYRATTMPPPNCPECKQPAVIAEPLHGILRCPDYHAFDWPRGFDGRGLPGFAGLRSCTCGETSWRLRLRKRAGSWWQNLVRTVRGETLEVVLACRCGKTFGEVSTRS